MAAQPRHERRPQQIVAELDLHLLATRTRRPTLYFVDDNFIGNRKAAKEMLPHLIEMAKAVTTIRLMFACEATLNISKADRHSWS